MKYLVIVFLLASLTVISMPTFAEIMPSTSPLVISTPYNSYISGDKVFVRVDANPNSNVTISMTDPSKNTVKHIVKATDEDGHISTSFILPFYAEQGTWILNATYGVNFDTVSFDVVALQKERMIKDITELEKYKPISVPFSKSDHVLVGTIMQVENVTENTLRYSIDVDFYLKNEQSFDFLTAISDNIQKPIGNSPAENAIISLNSPSFVKGDLVFVYLKNINGQQKILPQSFVIEKNWRSGAPGVVHTNPFKESCESGDEILFAGMVQKSEIYQSAKKDKPFDITLTIYDKQGSEVITKPLDVDANATYQYKLQTTNLPAGKYEYKINFSGGRSGELWTHDFIINSTKLISPLKQIKSGISIDEIKCNDNLILIQKYDGSSACVFPESIQKLVERGWIGNIIKIEPEIMNEIESTSIAKYALDPEFEVQRDIAKEIFKSLRTGEDTPYISFGLSNDRKSLDLYFDKTVFTIEKNEAYYQEFIDESFAEITIPINVIFVEGKGSGDE